MSSLGKMLYFLFKLIYYYLKNVFYWDLPGGLVVKNLPSNARAQVKPLVGELISHMPRGN